MFFYARIPGKDIINASVGLILDFIIVAWGQGKALESILPESL